MAGRGLAFVLSLFAVAAHAGTFSKPEALRKSFQQLADGFDGRVGICAGDVCVNGGQRFSLQSVMKLVVAAAVLEAVDRKALGLADPVVVRKENLSLYVQPIAKVVNEKGELRTTIEALLRGAVVASDSAATDILIERLGGPAKVQEFLQRKGIQGVRLDRDERHLQTEIVGLTWKAEFVDAAKLDAAIEQVPEATRSRAFAEYLRDERDTATPEGMAQFLGALASGKLLSPASTEKLMSVMADTVTFPDRLKAGTPAGWTLGHKTGTSGDWQGVTGATNDVGVLTAPDGGRVAIVAFIAASKRPPSERAALMAKAAGLTTSAYRSRAGSR